MDAAYVAGSTANAGLMAFTRALGGASHHDGIRVVGINPPPPSPPPPPPLPPPPFPPRTPRRAPRRS